MTEPRPLVPDPAALEFLLTRRSRPAKTLTAPGPDRDALRTILTAASRTPDHGKLEPWRFIVLEGAAQRALADLIRRLGAARGREAERLERDAAAFETAPLTLAVIASPKESDTIPAVEQTLSAGAACLGALNAALALGWGANWLTGWMAHDREFLREGLGLSEGEYVAGFIHMGTAARTPPERPRPDIDAITEWRRA